MPRKKAQDPTLNDEQNKALANQPYESGKSQEDRPLQGETFPENSPFPGEAPDGEGEPFPAGNPFPEDTPPGIPPLMVEDAAEPPPDGQEQPPDGDIPGIEESVFAEGADGEDMAEGAGEDTSPGAGPAKPSGEDLNEMLAAMDGEGFPEGGPAEEGPSSDDPPAAQEAGPSRTVRHTRPASSAAPRRVVRDAGGVLTIDAKAEIMSEEEQEEALWHEVRNAYRTRRMLTGTLSGIEEIGGRTVAILDYKGFRVMIPVKEMMLRMGRSPSGNDYVDLMRRQSQVLNSMMSAEIDFVVKGIETRTRSIGGSRKDAMLRKRRIFYLDKDASDRPRIYPGRVVQARVIAVAEKVIRVEAFGVECSILARDLAWDWIGDAKERFSVGDRILVRILEVDGDTPEDLAIRADVRSVSTVTSRDKLEKCQIQSKYAGTVTDVRRGVVYIRLTSGVNAIAHACLDRRMPGKKDTVSFAVTRIDEEYGVALGIITRIIKQNL